jgi:PAS domain S-box-containing protein
MNQQNVISGRTCSEIPGEEVGGLPKARILVVEDERIVGRDIQTTLQRAGYEVPTVVSSGAQAIAKASELDLDLVLMDVMLSGNIDGVEASHQIRASKEIPIVYLTANGDRALLDRIKSTEPIAFILKPYDEQDLLTTIEITLHQYRAQRNRTQEELQASEVRYRELFETACDGIAVLNLAGKLEDCNQAYLALLGYQNVEELRSRSLLEMTAADFRKKEARLMRNDALRKGHSKEYEKEGIRKDGSRVPVSARCWLRRDGRGKAIGFWQIVRDVSEKKEAERRQMDYQTQLQSLMTDLSLAEDRERQRIASDIHDRISQTLAVCQMRLGGLSRFSPPPAVQEEVEECCRLLQRSIRDTSSLIFELSPPVLHQLGLPPALEWLGEKLHQEHGLPIEIHHDESPLPLSSDQRSALFRAVCELVNNVIKHARATRVRITLRRKHERLEIKVEDDGSGFVVAESLLAKRERGGFGLFHIRERLRAWGGTLEIHSRPGSGTCAVVLIPFENSKSPN